MTSIPLQFEMLGASTHERRFVKYYVIKQNESIEDAMAVLPYTIFTSVLPRVYVGRRAYNRGHV